MRLLLAAMLACALLGGCPKAPPTTAEQSPLTVAAQAASNDAYTCWETTDVGRRSIYGLVAVVIVEQRKQTAEMQKQTTLLERIERNTRRVP